MHGRTPALVSKDGPHGISSRWPSIGRFVSVDGSTGEVGDDFAGWSRRADELDPARRAVGYAEWADFWEWRLEQRAAELAGDRRKRHLVATWTDSMAYCCRRSAAWARGEDPGDWIPQHMRRPDLTAEGRAVVAEIIAELDARQTAARQLAMAG